MRKLPIPRSVGILFLLVGGAAAAWRAPASAAPARAIARTIPRAAGVPYTAADLVGEWDSAGCASAHLIGARTPDAFFRRSYLFSETSFNVRYSYYADPACRVPIFSERINGWSELGRARPDLPHTREALVVYGTVLLTADSAIAQKALASCGAAAWTIGQEYDLTAQGCPAAGLRPRSQCIGDYELVRVENGVYYPGYRAADMCLRAGRPTRTQAVGARKVSG